MESSITELLILAVRAPSGDNMQPWRFKVKGNTLSVFLVPDKDTSLYNWNEYGSYIAIGALLQNISALSPSFQLQTVMTLFPSQEEIYRIANIVFSIDKRSLRDEQIINAVARRATNRKNYRETPLARDLRRKMIDIFAESQCFLLSIIENPQDRRQLGKYFAQNESVLFAHRALHDFFFEHIIWEKQSAKPGYSQTQGFLEETLEIPPHGRLVFRSMRSWAVTSILRMIGLTKLIVGDNSKLYASGSAIGIISYTKDQALSPADCVMLGMKLQQVWLLLTIEGYWLHPLMGISTLIRRHREGGAGLSESHVKTLSQAIRGVAILTNLSESNIIGAFRVGRADDPSRMTERDAPIFISALD